MKFVDAWVMKGINDENIKEGIRDRVLNFYKDNSFIEIKRFKDSSNKKTVKEGYQIKIPFFENK